MVDCVKLLRIIKIDVNVTQRITGISRNLEVQRYYIIYGKY